MTLRSSDLRIRLTALKFNGDIVKSQYSGKDIIRAGEFLIKNEADLKTGSQFDIAMDILSYWRSIHEAPLEVAFKKLQLVSQRNDKNVILAKRLKRHVSIVGKLKRFDNMKLKNMQDIGGCRVVLTNEKKLRKVVRELKKDPAFKTNKGSYKYKDYLKKPKEDGYRSYHLMGRFSDLSGKERSIEIQLRTRIQHYWATALEIVDLFTNQALKSNQGDSNWKAFFSNISEQFSLMDSIHLFGSLTEDQQYDALLKLIHKNTDNIQSSSRTKMYATRLNVVDRFAAFSASLKVMEGNESIMSSGYVLLKIDLNKNDLDTVLFKEAESETAQIEYIEAEKSAANKAGKVVALVSTSAVGNIKEAYPNFFADSSQFIALLGLIEVIPTPTTKVTFPYINA